jgi:hypothetical protein
MYLVTSKKPKEKRVYLVDKDSPTLVEAAIIIADPGAKCISMKEIAFNEIFESSGGYYFLIKIKYEDVDGKPLTEPYLQEAENFDSAMALFKDKITYGEIVSAVRTEILEILK